MAKKSGRQKYYSTPKVVTSYGTFDSVLEKDCYDLLTKFKIKFKAQVVWELMPSYRSWEDKGITRIKMKIDFVIIHKGKYIVVDTKGWATEVAKIKYKLLGYQMQHKGMNHEIHFLKNKKEVQNFVIDLYDKLKNDEKARNG